MSVSASHAGRTHRALPIHEDGDLMFTVHDVLELGKKSAAALDRVFSAANRLNATSEEGMEELAKN